MSKGLYPIRTISAMTGVNPVTLRAWERRYGLIRPQRTPKGHRLYTEDDINRIQQILVLLERGIPISQAREVLDDSPPAGGGSTGGADNTTTDDSWQRHHQQWARAVASLDERAVDDACSDSLSLFTVDAVMHRLACPLLDELDAAGHDNPAAAAQRHLLRTALRNRLGARFLHHGARSHGPRLLAACPAGETDDIRLLLLSIGAQAQGYRVLLLGTDVAPATLVAAARGGCCAGVLLAGRGRKPPRGLGDALDSLACPIFLLEAATNWPVPRDAETIPLEDPDTALRVIGRRLPPAHGMGNGRV